MTMKINNTHELILDFIAQFHDPSTVKCFSQGMCYWFAEILSQRFGDEEPCDIVYDSVANHFGCMIGDYVYDITGDVSEQYNWVIWNVYEREDPKHTARIYRDCIFKIPDGAEVCVMCRHCGFNKSSGNAICKIDKKFISPNQICNKGKYKER